MEKLRYSDRAEPGMKHAVMLYKSPGKMGKSKLGSYDYVVVDKLDEEAFSAALKDGWFKSLSAAIAKQKGVDEKDLEPKVNKPPEKVIPKMPKLEPEKVPEHIQPVLTPSQQKMADQKIDKGK